MSQKLNKEQVEKAVSALYTFLKKRDEGSNQLFDDDHYISLTLALKKTPESGRVKPYRIPVQHGLYEGKSICLFTKDPHKPIKAKLEENPVDGVDKVIGIGKLRKNYRQYEDKRKLLHSYDLFLADERIIPLLPACLGKKFFDKKKQPAPVNLTRNLTNALETARDSSYFFLNAGPTCMIKIARTGFTRQQVVENILGSINSIVDHVPKKWKNIQAVFLRTHDSIALPIYTALPGNFRIDNTALPVDTPKKAKKRSLAEAGSVQAAIEKNTETPAKKVAKVTNGSSVKKSVQKSVKKSKAIEKQTEAKDETPEPVVKTPAKKVTKLTNGNSVKKSVKKATSAKTTPKSPLQTPKKAPTVQKKAVTKAPATAKGKKTPQKKTTAKKIQSAKK